MESEHSISWKKHWYLYLLAICLVLFYPFIAKMALEKMGVLASSAQGHLIVKDKGKEISRLPITSCRGDIFGVQLFTKDKESVYVFPPDKEKPKEIGVEYHSPPQGGRLYARPCSFTFADVRQGYSWGAYALINFLKTKSYSREKGQEYWSGSVQGNCFIERTQKTIEIDTHFKNCHPIDSQK